MTTAWLLLPDFLLIATGWALCRFTAINRPVWDGVERLVYFVLFPVLLFTAILNNPIELRAAMPLALSGLAVTVTGVVLSYGLRAGSAVDARLHACGAQTAFRFNSYVALALAERLAGAQGLAWTAVLVSVCVPLCNIAAVWPLARQGGHPYARELLRNPLILSTLAGLAGNLLGLRLPDVMGATLQRLGTAALPLGLMAVGAGLQMGALREAPRLASALLAIRHLALPAMGLLLAASLAMPPAQQAVLVAFAALPTASSCYVLAVRMGGNGAYVAGLVTLSTLIGMAGLPLTLLVLQRMQG